MYINNSSALCFLVQECVWLPSTSFVKSQLISLASHQRSLVEILQKQLHLVEMYVNTKARPASQSPSQQPSKVVRQQPDHFSTLAFFQLRETHICADSQRKESPRRVTSLMSLPSNSAMKLTLPRPSPLSTHVKKTPSHTHLPNKKASSCQSSNLQHINFQMKEDNSIHLSNLIQRGVMPPVGALQLLLKVWQSSYIRKTYFIFFCSKLSMKMIPLQAHTCVEFCHLIIEWQGLICHILQCEQVATSSCY